MPDDTKNPAAVPATTAAANMPTLGDDAFPTRNLPLSLRVWFDDAMFNRIKTIAMYLSRATGVTPRHLIGKEEACFSVVIDSINWRLSPYMVARSTFQTPDGKIGYEGKLVGAILEQSGEFEEAPRPEYFGDWSRVLGKFEIVRKGQTDGGKSYPQASYTKADEQGLGVIVRGRLRNESTPREFSLELVQCYPRFSTLWATDPKTQIYYTALRRFASAAVPHLMFGIPFDREQLAIDVTHSAIDVGASPAEPTRAGFAAGPSPAAGPVIEHDDTGWGDDTGQQEATADPAATQDSAEQDSASFVELYGGRGEVVGQFDKPTDFLRTFMENAGAKVSSQLERAAYLEANKPGVELAIGRLGDHPLAVQAREYYAPPAPPAPQPAPPAAGVTVSLVPPVVMKMGKPDIMVWNAALDRAAAHIRDMTIFKDFQMQALAAAQAAGLTPGLVNSLKLRLARYQGEVEALNR